MYMLKNKKKYFFILNEINVLYFIFLVFISRDVYLYKIRVFNKAATVPLSYIVSICYKYKLFKYIHELQEIDLTDDRWIYENYPHYDNEKTYIELYGLLKNNRRYEYWNDPFNDYLYSFKAVNYSYIHSIVKDVLWVEWLDKKFRNSSYSLVGSYSDLEIYFLKNKNIKLIKVWNVLCNLFTLISGGGYLFYWLLIRTRPYKIKKVYYELIADNELSMREFFSGLVENKRSIVFYNWRNKNRKLEDNEISLTASRIDVFRFAFLIFFFIRDSLFFLKKAILWDSVLFFEQFRQIITRYTYEAFFLKHSAKSFFVMDDYANEHIVRTMVLRNFGIKSISYNHGLPFRINQAHIWKYIDYDLYYVYGMFIYNKYYKKTWSNKTIVKAVGSLRIPTKCYPKMKIQDRPKDILFLWSRTEKTKFDNELINAIYVLSDTFKDRKIYVRPKPTRIADGAANNLLKVLVSHPRDNIILEDEDLTGMYLTYDLMVKSTYAIGVGSTAVAEAVQCGCISFFLDYDKRTDDVYYRNFKELCVENISDVILKIKGIESKVFEYDFKKLNGLIDLSQKNQIDIVFQDLNLS